MHFFAAFISLLNTIDCLQNSDRISPDSPTNKIFRRLLFSFGIIYMKLFKHLISKYSGTERVNALDEQIKDALHKLEDIIESHVSDQLLLSQSDQQSDENETSDRPSPLYSINLLDIKQDILSLTKVVKEMVDEYIKEVSNLSPDEERKDEDDDAVPSRIASGGEDESKMVGLSDQLEELKSKLTRHDQGKRLNISIAGMPGIGKTTLAKKIFYDQSIVSHFDRCAWVTVGRNCQLEEIVQGILAQVAPDSNKTELLTERFERRIRDFKASLTKILQRILPQVNPDGDERLTEGDDEIAPRPESSLKRILKGILARVSKMLMKGYQKIAEHVKARLNKILIAQDLKRILGCTRYLIVFDDIWDEMFLKKVGGLLPKGNNGSKALCTSRLRALKGSDAILHMRLMNEDESWDLFREKVFDKDELWPLQLEGTGKKIVKRCDGLPLTIVTVAKLLSKAEKTTKYWHEVATQKKHQLFIDAYDEISKVLYPSYDLLPQCLKTFFLHLGAFPQNNEIPISKLMKHSTADGSFAQVKMYSKLLYGFNLVIPSKETTSDFYQTKTIQLHSSLWHLCNREAKKIKFFHILSDRADGLEEGIESQRQLCIHNNILLGVKDVYDSIENNCTSTARSLLCLGPYHHYPVPICSGLRLLRVLDALSIRLYEFPIQVLNLVLLRYLAFTYNGRLPTSISKLYYLQSLIIRQLLSIKSCGGPLYLPIEIWHMKDLMHLQIMGSDLPDPCGASLPNLSTLLDVSPHSCTKNVLNAIPKLKELGIRIEMAPDAIEPLSCFDHISYLRKLDSLKCVIVNPDHRFEVVAPLVPLSSFPLRLRRLTLSGLGYPWEELSKIASLPNLEVLKLRCYAFRGSMWEVKKKGFQKLKFLLIRDIDLVQWKVGHKSFRKLEYLSIKHCYKLEEIHGESDIYPNHKLEVVDCNPSIMTWAKKIKEAALEEHPNLDVHVHSSW